MYGSEQGKPIMLLEPDSPYAKAVEGIAKRTAGRVSVIAAEMLRLEQEADATK
jgi:MinD-like ATPase involved in chromosome partitioning or flagellar assembly